MVEIVTRGGGGGEVATTTKRGGPMEEGDRRRPPLPPPLEPLIKCPRCDSMNTKFCYYNNYSMSQPRYFCKTCKRYWTKGGALRNIPFGGGGSRKSKKSPKPSPPTAGIFIAPHQPSPSLVHQLLLTRTPAITGANSTAVSMIHPSVYGMGGIDGSGYQFQHPTVDIHRRLSSFHGHDFMNDFQPTGLVGSSTIPSAIVGASSSNNYGWNQRNLGPISATTVTTGTSTVLGGRDDEQFRQKQYPYV